MASILIDTNILVYIYDVGDARRQEKAISVMRHLEETSQGCLSAQCLAEFVNVMVAKRRLSLDEAVQQVERWIQVFPIYPLTAPVVLEAARGVRDHGLAYYDAQIWAAARLNQLPTIFSEDFQDGQTLEGIRFVNPFAPQFDLSQWN